MRATNSSGTESTNKKMTELRIAKPAPVSNRRAAAENIGPAAEHQQREQHAGGVGGVDDGGGEHREVHLLRVQRVHGCGHRRADHDRGETEREQDEGGRGAQTGNHNPI